jgi:hypothetical protein
MSPEFDTVDNDQLENFEADDQVDSQDYEDDEPDGEDYDQDDAVDAEPEPFYGEFNTKEELVNAYRQLAQEREQYRKVLQDEQVQEYYQQMEAQQQERQQQSEKRARDLALASGVPPDQIDDAAPMFRNILEAAKDLALEEIRPQIEPLYHQSQQMQLLGQAQQVKQFIGSDPRAEHLKDFADDIAADIAQGGDPRAVVQFYDRTIRRLSGATQPRRDNVRKLRTEAPDVSGGAPRQNKKQQSFHGAWAEHLGLDDNVRFNR